MSPFTPPPTSNIDLDATREEKLDFERIEAALAKASIKLDTPTAAVIGLLSIETRTQQDYHHRWHQIRSEPLPDFGGAEFRYDVPRGRVLPKNPIVAGIAHGAPAFVKARDAIVARVDAAREMAAAALQRLTGAWCDQALVAVGISVEPDGRSLTTILEIRTLGQTTSRSPNASRPGRSMRSRPSWTHCWSGTPGAPDFGPRSWQTRVRLGRRDDAPNPRHGRQGSALGDGAAGATWYRGSLVPARPGIHSRQGAVAAGVVRVDFGNSGIGLDLVGDELTIFKLVSAKLLAARVGRPLARLTKDQFLPAESTMFDARRTHAWSILTLAIPKTLIPIARTRGRNSSG